MMNDREIQIMTVARTFSEAHQTAKLAQNAIISLMSTHGAYVIRMDELAALSHALQIMDDIQKRTSYTETQLYIDKNISS